MRAEMDVRNAVDSVRNQADVDKRKQVAISLEEGTKGPQAFGCFGCVVYGWRHQGVHECLRISRQRANGLIPRLVIGVAICELT